MMNLTKRIKIYLKVEKFLKIDLWQYLITFLVIGFCGWLFNKSIEIISFCIAHCVIRPFCDKEYHCNDTLCCLLFGFLIVIITSIFIIPLSISLLSSILFALFEVYFGYLLQSKIDFTTHKNIYSMNEKELYEHCRNKGLSEEDCRIAYFVVIERLKGKELYSAIGYCERHSKRKRAKILSIIK